LVETALFTSLPADLGTKIRDAKERDRIDLELQTALEAPLIATKGWAASDLEHLYTRTLKLAQRFGHQQYHLLALMGFSSLYTLRGKLATAKGYATQLLDLAHHTNDITALVDGHNAYGICSYWLGDFQSALRHFAKGLSAYDSDLYRPHTLLARANPKVSLLPESTGNG
jgi:tetratricopeptide (TPR) repeat protein